MWSELFIAACLLVVVVANCDSLHDVAVASPSLVLGVYLTALLQRLLEWQLGREKKNRSKPEQEQ